MNPKRPIALASPSEGAGTASSGAPLPPETPFSLANTAAYKAWREGKLRHYPFALSDLLVTIATPEAPTALERIEVLSRCAKANMAVMVTPPPPETEDPERGRERVRRIGAAFGLEHLDHNMLSGEDGLTALQVEPQGTASHYIPYTDKPINWHTDGYYNTAEDQVRGLMLYCARPAESGGANALLDPEIVYILLRDQDPALIDALMQPDAMTIPGNAEPGHPPRPDRSGPVFSVIPSGPGAGHLHMRYTARARNVIWKQTPEMEAARQALSALLADPGPYGFEARLEPGQVLICNNVLHTRTRFHDSPTRPRLIYRARYRDRIAAPPEFETEPC